MRKGYLLVLLACLFAVPAFGVPSHENYIGDNDVKGWMHSYYGSWTPGQSPEGGGENENFYIGRVRPLKRFTNTASQVKKGDTKAANRKLLWWVPINQTDKGGWRSLPSYCFDSEAFSMWSYITTYGNWTEGFLRQPGAFADACHKNGVLSGVVSAAAWAVGLTSSDGGHGQNYQALIDDGADKLLKLMSYYGIDGLGFNSEQTWGMRSGMKNLMAQCQDKKGDYAIGDRLHFDFYQFSTHFDGDPSGTYDWDDFFPDANLFLNYGWGMNQLSTSESTANSTSGGSPWNIYAGMDQQGRSYADWIALNNSNLSIGIWGAHNKNMIYEQATEDGTTPDAIQHCYMRKAEQFFTGGTQNPVNDKVISNALNSGNKDFFGVSKLMAAKSALSWVENGYFPFISYMNLGNGKFFNNEGVTTFDHEWYNIGMQDHLPTWRWWITDTYMGRSTSNVPADTKATFTYEDAWFGGSCMKVSFSNTALISYPDARYIQLFKTQFNIGTDYSDYELRVRYKVLQGKADISYVVSKENSEDTPKDIWMATMQETEWTEAIGSLDSELENCRIAQLGLKFEEVEPGTEILIGEVALVKTTETYEPVKPTIDTARTKWLKTTSRGVDFKIIWNCTPATASSAPIQKAVAALVTPTCTTSAKMTKSGCKLSSLTATGGTEEFALTGQQTAYNSPVYQDLTTSNVLKATAGSTITFTSKYQSSGGMHGFLYIDYNSNGEFSVTDEMVINTGAPGDSRITDGSSSPYTYTYTPFTIPSDLALGDYRVRFKVDWSSTDPCGTKNIGSNGGYMIDFTLRIVEDDGTTGGGGGGTGGGGTSGGVVSSEGAPIYNDEVDTWYFEIFAQQEGKVEQLVTTTTTWAGYAVEVPFDLEGNLKVRAGVRAVAPDGKTKSEIAWTDYMDASDITIIEGFSVDKPVIKPTETFTISFDDERHDPATYFKILKPDGTLVYQANNVTEFTYQITEKGLYDVEAKYTNQDEVEVTETIRAMVQVSGPEVGAVPEIQTLTADGNTVSSTQQLTNTGSVTFELNYTGREASGQSSRALHLTEKPFSIKATDFTNANGNTKLGNTAFTLCFWFKPETLSADNGTQLLNIRSISDGDPASEWGYIWSTIGARGADYDLAFRCFSANGGTHFYTTNYTFKEGYWYHMAVVADYNSGSRKLTFYLNGSSSAISQRKEYAGVEQPYTPGEWNSDIYSWQEANVIMLGGTARNRNGFTGAIDEVQIWNKALSATEVQQSMWHFDSAPDNLIGYWDFEAEADASGYLLSTGKGSNLKAFVANQWRLTDGTNDEGESNMVQKPTIGAGSPFLAGTFPITTTPSWKYTGKPTSRGTVTGNDVAGNTTVTYNAESDAEGYTATLTLTNPWGKDTESIKLVVVDGTVDLEGKVIENLNVYPNPFVEALHIQFAKAGDYELEVLSLDGRLVQSQSVNAAAGQITRVAVNGETGAYLVRVKMQGTVVKTMKLVKK